MTIRTINSVKNPRWGNYEQTIIDMDVDFDEEDQEFVPFTASPNDVEPHGPLLYTNALNGDYGPIADFVPPENITGDHAMTMLRNQRTKLLEQSDYIEMPTKWATLTPEKQTEWATYRNALRDLPENSPNAEKHWNEDYTSLTWVNVTWPVKPS